MLPIVEAVELLGHSAQGQTLPLVFDCTSDAGLVETFQVKVEGKRNGLTKRELACEALGTLCAHEVGLRVSTPAAVRLSSTITADVERRYHMEVTGEFAVGVAWVDLLRPMVLPVDVASKRRGREVPNPALGSSASVTLALDLLLSNSDRTAANPNLAWDGETLFVFDFEHCLELPGRGVDEMLEVHRQLVANLYASHVFGAIVSPLQLQDAIKGCADRLLGGLKGLGSAVDANPWRPEWQRLLDYIEHVCQHRDVIIEAAGADT